MYGSVVIFGKAKAEISIVPFQSGTLTYTGGTLTPVWNGFDANALEIGGTTSAVNAGTYTATFTPKDGYVWSDGTTGAKSVTWTISGMAVAIPAKSGSLTYTGAAQTQAFTNYDSAKMTRSGTVTATNAGTYSATFTLKANYQWSDGTTGAKTVSWTIAKAAGSLSLDKTSLTLGVSAATGTIGVTRAGDGAVSATSSNTGVVTVSVSGTTVTVKKVAGGSATITIKVAAGTNHTAPASKTCAVTVELASATLNANDWATIRAVSDAGEAANYWEVGDTKSITINGKVGNYTFSNLTIDAFIIGIDHNSAKEGTKRIHFQIGKIGSKDVCLCDDNYGKTSEATSSGYFQMRNVSGGGIQIGDDIEPRISGNDNLNPLPEYPDTSTVTNAGGWSNSYMRKTILGNSKTPANPLSGSLMAALPSDLRAVMKSITKRSDNTGGGTTDASNVTSTTDYLTLGAEYEYHGTRKYANTAEKTYQQQYAYYKAGNSKVKYKHSTSGIAAMHWTRSVNVNSSYNFCVVGDAGDVSDRYANYSLGIAPIFAV